MAANTFAVVYDKAVIFAWDQKWVNSHITLLFSAGKAANLPAVWLARKRIRLIHFPWQTCVLALWAEGETETSIKNHLLQDHYKW
ncbi:MAG: hypothetical protein Fur0021_37370 [Candidatus Promineifilaceae bacterium]